jgi:hypothetical protein
MIKRNKGSTILATPIIWVITIFIFIFFIVFMVRVLEPFTIYQKISETTLKYIFVMEEFGCLNKKEKEALQQELAQKGLDISNINIYATEVEKEYGEMVELNIEYKYPFKKTVFNNTFNPQYEEDSINICVSKKGVSKR